MFSIILGGHSNNDIIYIYLNNKIMTSMLLPHDSSHVDSGSATFYTSLKVGDRVRVTGEASINYMYSYFSGMLIQWFMSLIIVNFTVLRKYDENYNNTI